MRISNLVGVLSLAGNVALLGAVFFSKPAAPRPEPPANGTATPTPPASPPKPNTALASPTGDSATPAVLASATWSQLHDSDLAKVAARLRAAGFPPAMVRAAMGALVDERFAPRLRAIAAAGQKPFWQARSDAYDPKNEAELSAVRREQRALMREVHGDDINPEIHRVFMLQEFGRELSAEKSQRIDAVKRIFEEKFSVAQAKLSGGAQLPEDFQQIHELQKAMHTEIGKLLSPDELFEYELRNHSSADSLRSELAAFRPTEAEFRALFPLQRALDERFSLKYGVNTAEDMAPRAAAKAQLAGEIKALLGPERYAEYELSRDYQYQQTAKVTQRLNLPSSATTEVYAIQKETQQRADAVRTNPAVPATDRPAQLAALANEATAKIANVLGPDGLEAYKQYSGQWLQQLTPRPRPNAKAP